MQQNVEQSGDNTLQDLNEEALEEIQGGLSISSVSSMAKFYKDQLEIHPSNILPAMKTKIDGVKAAAIKGGANTFRGFIGLSKK